MIKLVYKDGTPMRKYKSKIIEELLNEKLMKNETYQDLEDGMQKLLPMERQMLLAEVYHYCWYSTEAYDELRQFLNKWEAGCQVKAVFFKPESEDSTNQI